MIKFVYKIKINKTVMSHNVLNKSMSDRSMQLHHMCVMYILTASPDAMYIHIFHICLQTIYLQQTCTKHSQRTYKDIYYYHTNLETLPIKCRTMKCLNISNDEPAEMHLSTYDKTDMANS